MFSDIHSQVQLGARPLLYVLILPSKLAFARNSQVFKFHAVQLSTTASSLWLATENASYHMVCDLNAGVMATAHFAHFAPAPVFKSWGKALSK